ncbi:MAG: hypothetical protein U5N26_07665 [Candidatus Marinimicrobia bacterium]|nr:hypothetical protein [Candidatus Neomarinimicrobiota bacterium]
MDSLRPVIEKARSASAMLKALDKTTKTAILSDMASAIHDNRDMLIRLNRQDIENAKAMHLSPLMMERLQLDGSRLKNIAELLRKLSVSADISVYNMKLKVSDKNLFTRAPEIIGIIYESCPYITAVAAGLSIKGGHGHCTPGRQGSLSHQYGPGLNAVGCA